MYLFAPKTSVMLTPCLGSSGRPRSHRQEPSRDALVCLRELLLGTVELSGDHEYLRRKHATWALPANAARKLPPPKTEFGRLPRKGGAGGMNLGC